MSTDHVQKASPAPRPRRLPRTLWVAALMTALVGAFFLWREHSGHVAGFWPYLLLLACPLMHLFHGHGGHGHHGGHGTDSGSTPNRKD